MIIAILEDDIGNDDSFQRMIEDLFIDLLTGITKRLAAEVEMDAIDAARA